MEVLALQTDAEIFHVFPREILMLAFDTTATLYNYIIDITIHC